jgi:branched-chain amino acid transport system substrate-binding protein
LEFSAIKAGYSDLGGPGAVLAAQMAADDYGGKALGKPIEIISADLLNKPDVAAAIAAAGTTSRALTRSQMCR